MGKVCGNGTGTESALYDLKKVPRGTKSIMEKSRGTESITEKSRGRESAKCDEGTEPSKGFSGRAQVRRGRSTSKMASMKWQKKTGAS